MNPLHELFPPLPPTPDEHRKRILAQLAAEKLGKTVTKGITNEPTTFQ